MPHQTRTTGTTPQQKPAQRVTSLTVSGAGRFCAAVRGPGTVRLCAGGRGPGTACSLRGWVTGFNADPAGRSLPRPWSAVRSGV
ncbi:hypothetical protein SY2F82_08780 [Streptomyces sp. Y2F8-2]|nr:hypothetical protein SY2F82_08780 [Streptomyces sp. Y2F8-2]